MDEITTQLERDEIPFAFATKSKEKEQMKYKKTLAAADSVNKRGWKLCHIQEVGLGSAKMIESLPIERLITYFRLFLKPSNHFLVPLHLAGFGEISEVIEEIRTCDS